MPMIEMSMQYYRPLYMYAYFTSEMHNPRNWDLRAVWAINGSHPTFLAMRLLSGIALKTSLLTRI